MCCNLGFQGGALTPSFSSFRSRCPSIAENNGDDSPANLHPTSPFHRSQSLESIISARDIGGDSDEPRLRRRVRFDTELSLHTDFTPYGQIYGLHPRSFFLNDEGRMVQELTPAALSCRDLEDTDEGDTIECTLACGVGYRSAPRMNAHATDFSHIAQGEQTTVRERLGEWVRDDLGWLPLFVRGLPVFELVPPTYSIDLGLPRSGAMTVRPGCDAVE